MALSSVSVVVSSLMLKKYKFDAKRFTKVSNSTVVDSSPVSKPLVIKTGYGYSKCNCTCATCGCKMVENGAVACCRSNAVSCCDSCACESNGLFLRTSYGMVSNPLPQLIKKMVHRIGVHN
jgi:hypothetical protein